MRKLGSRKLKEKKVKEIIADLKEAKAIVLTDFRGLVVAEISKLRQMLKEEGVHYRVVKNTLTRLAVQELDLNDLEPYLQGPTALAYGYDDPVVPVKLLVKFAKENEHLKIKGGVLEKDILDEKELRQIAALPSKDVLLAKTLSCIQSPLAGMLNVLQGNIRNLVYVLQAIKDNKEESA